MDYVVAKERSDKSNVQKDRQNSQNNNGANSLSKRNQFQRNVCKFQNGSRQFQNRNRSTAEALVVNGNDTSQNSSYFDKCRFCQGKHWSDECPKYKTIDERKAQLLLQVFTHHRSLCPKKFRSVLTSVHLSEEYDSSSSGLSIGVEQSFTSLSEQRETTSENMLISSSEIVLMQTAKAEVNNPNDSLKQTTRLLFDSGSQRTYISQKSVELESIGISDDDNSTEDSRALKMFKETLEYSNGRYYVTWPWKNDNVDLPVNRVLVLSRLKSCLARMKKKQELLEKYNSFIQDQLDKGIVEKVEEHSTEGLKHYIPHHAVITPNKTTTKLRLVYDASAKPKTEVNSLNECLYRGPVLLKNLCGIFMRFRLNQVAIVADIEKAFLQVVLQKSDRDVTRFLWLKNYKDGYASDANLQEYRFCRVPFGIISSPFLLAVTVESHLDTYQSPIARKIKDIIYVDNLISG
ncbi:unnamed protein product [Mytilus coruscus]|uniref:Reverse transcriptase domain-containing protein n=1 Tax=Mytilus coruscus TaxID=42192 RepID=A0A6J8DA42_MYTCO|nr:unnamed protein product [Mytilus coruscus]